MPVRVQLRLQLARNVVGLGLTIAALPNQRGSAVETMRFVVIAVVDKYFVRASSQRLNFERAFSVR